MAFETAQAVMDAVTQEASFDVTPTQALTWANRMHQLMVMQARALKETVSAGDTVANQTDYSLPSNVVEVYEFDVGGIPYGRGRRTDVAEWAQGWLLLKGPGGVIAANADASGGGTFSITPPPTDIVPISVFAAVEPPDLTAGTDSLLVPKRYTEGLIRGAMSIGYGREGNTTLEQAGLAAFNAATEAWRLDVLRQFRGSGPALIRVVGINA